MKRSTRWTTAIAATALLAVPAASRAQEPAPTSPPSAQPSTQRPAATDTQQPGSAQEHLRQAKSALNDIPAASLTGTVKTRVDELKRHISAAEKASDSGKSGKWETEAAAADRILSELLESQSAAATPTPTGTSGTSAPPSTMRGKTDTGVTLDDMARTKLQEVRTHIAAFAAAMSRTPGAPGAEPAATAASAEPPASAAAAGASPAAAPTASAPTASAPTASAPTASPAAPTTSPTEPPAATPAEPAAKPQTAQTPQTGSPSSPTASAPATGTQQVDPETVKRHLTAARNSLSELTQLPAAAQLTGDARTQVSQLIANFNELITTNVEWRASYAKVQANLNALVSDQRPDESPAPASPAAPANPAGAVGTSGAVTLDPAIRAKLVEFRTHLSEFEKAAGGGATSGAANTPSEPAASPAASAASTPSEPAAAAAASPAPTPAEPAPSSSPASSAAPASSTPTSSTQASPSSSAGSPSPSSSASSAGTAGAVGTSGSTAAAAAADPQTPTPESRQPASSTSRQSGASQSEAMRHIEAIEAILNGSAGATGTSGKRSATATSGSTLDHAQIEQIKTHLSELRKALNKDR